MKKAILILGYVLAGFFFGMLIAHTAKGDTPPINYLFNSPLLKTGNTISIPQATGSTNGFLGATDWTFFNNKQPALGFIPVNKAGDTMTGLLVLSGNPTTALGAATKQYVDGQTTITGNLTSSTTGLTVTNGTNAVAGSGTQLSIQNATTTQPGLLTAADWNTFNAKQSALTFSTPLVNTTGTISCNTASGLQAGCLSSTDWSTFNGKQNALSFGNLTDAGTDGITVTGGTGSVIGGGAALSQHVADTTHNGYLSSTDWNTFNSKQSALTTGNVTSTTTGLSLTGGTGAVIGSGLTVNVQTASGTQPGLLSSTDWSTFNNKQSSLSFGNLTSATTSYLTLTGGTGAVIGGGAALTVNASSAGGTSNLAARDISGNITSTTFTGALSGNASTASALAANPTDCSANQYATTIDASGNLTCAQVSYTQLSGTLPNPSATTLGGVESYAAVTSQWINAISTSGVPSSTQPACSDLSNASASCSTDATNAANISSGLLALARGGTHVNLSATGGTSQVLKQTTVGGDISVARLACADLSNSATSCSTDTTNATNISSGLLALARGGTHVDLSATGGTSQVLKQTTVGGDISVARLACADLSNSVASCSTDTTNAANVSSGLLALARGGTNADLSATGGTSQVLKQTTLGGNVSVARLACADLSNSSASCATDATNASNISSGTLGAARLPNPSATTLGGVESLAATTHQWINTISTSGVPSSTQPACSDLSNAAASCSTDATNAANISSGTLATTRGGTGASLSPAIGSLLYASSTAAMAATTVGSTTQVLHGATGAPTWSAVSLTADVTGILPIANGGTNSNTVTTAPAASSWAGWDTNKNISSNNTIEGYATTATAAATTTLTVASAWQQYFTGSTTQTVTLPVASTLVLGQSFLVVNNSTGAVTVKSSGANTITTMVGSSSAIFTCILASGTTAASWSASYVPSMLSTNTANSLVLRDGSGNFSAGTVTAAVTGTASGNTTYVANNHGVVLSGSGNTMTVVAPDASTTKVLTSGGTTADPSWQNPNGLNLFYSSSKVSTSSTNVTSASFVTFSNSPAFSITPTSSGTFSISSSFPFYVDASGTIGVARIVNTSGSATLLKESQATIFGSASAVLSNVTVTSTYTLTSGVTYVFDIQALRNTGSGNVVSRGDLANFYMFGSYVGP